MRRYLFPILFVLVLVTPFVLRATLTAGGTPAARDPKRRIVVMTPHAEGIRREFQDGFSRWLKARGEPDVFVDYRNFGGGANDIVKYFDSSVDLYKATGSFNVDLVWGGGDYLFDVQLRKPQSGMTEGYLEAFKLRPELKAAAYPTPDIGGVPLYQPDGYWYGSALSSFGIVYNKDVVRYLGVPEPKTWADLADPKLRGWLVLADPTRSASASTAFMAIVEKAMSEAWEADGPARARHAELREQQKAAVAAGDKSKAAALGREADDVYQRAMDPGWRRGMGLIRQIASNTRVFSNNSAAVPGVVGSGDAAAGMAIDFYGRTEIESSGEDRVGYVEPAGATIVNPDPVALARGAPHRDLAMLFVEYVLSADGQRLWNARVGSPGGPTQTALRRLPIVRGVYGDAYATDHFADRVNPFEAAGTFNTKADRKATSRFLGTLVKASAMDVLPDLVAARARVAGTPADDATIGTFPFGQFDTTEPGGRKTAAGALARQKAYQAASPVDRLAMVRQWVNEFEAEYAEVGKAK